MTISNKGAEFLQSRGISLDTAVRFEMFTAHGPDGSAAAPTLDDDANYIAIPYRRGLDTVYIQFRDMRPECPHDQRYRSPKNAKPAIFNSDVIACDPGLDGRPITIFEGALDAIAAAEAGAQRVIALPGTSFAGLVAEAGPDFSDIEEIILATDADAAGRKLQDELIEILEEPRCKVVTYANGCKDMGEVLRDHGAAEVLKCLKTATHVPISGLYRARDVPRSPPLEIIKLHSFGPEFTDHIRLAKRKVSLWTGEPGHGKSAFLKAVLWALGKESGWVSAAGFFEEDADLDCIPDFQRLVCGRDPESEEEADAALTWIDDKIMFIGQPDDGALTPEWFIRRAEAAARRHKVGIVVADPWSQFEFQDSRFSETEMVRRYMVAFHRLARDCNVHVAVVAHPRKSSEYGGTTKIADGNDIAGSLHFRGRCDIGVSIQRDPVADCVTNVMVWKVRRRVLGKLGMFSLLFHEISGRYTPMSQDDVAWARGEEPGNIVEFGKGTRKKRASGARRRADIHE